MDAPSNQTMAYGQHKGRSFSWIVTNCPGYVVWARTQPSPMRQTRELIDYANDTNVPTDTYLARIINDTMRVGCHKGKTFAWICRCDPEYVAQHCQPKVPHCSTEFFRLVQWDQHDGTAQFEQTWARLRVQHLAWMYRRAISLGQTFGRTF